MIYKMMLGKPMPGELPPQLNLLCPLHMLQAYLEKGQMILKPLATMLR